jgi:hypothetical protein
LRRTRGTRPIHQGALTVIAAVDPKEEAELGRELEAGTRGEDVFGSVASIHFARLVLVPRGPTGIAYLALETSYDGDEGPQLDAIAGLARTELAPFFARCADFPGKNAEHGALLDWLKKRAVAPLAFYRGHPGLTVDDIRSDERLRKHVQEELTARQSEDGFFARTALRHRRDIQEILRKREGDDHVIGPLDRGLPSENAFRVAFLGAIAAIGLPMLCLFPVTVPATLVLARALRALEERDGRITDAMPVRRDEPLDDPRLARIARYDDGGVQNPLTHCVEVKADALRWPVLWLVLWAIDFLAKWYFVHGKLGSIASIHFARWVRMPDGRLLFFSNYDGSWESYLGDFIDKASLGLSAVWSNTEGFPRTRWLIKEGSRDEERFKRWTRDHQLPTPIWYSAYPDRSVQNVLDDARFREDALRPLDETGAREWLKAL